MVQHTMAVKREAKKEKKLKEKVKEILASDYFRPDHSLQTIAFLINDTEKATETNVYK